MIDSDWFTSVRCLSGASLSDPDLARLAQILGEEEEVLPYLLLRTDAFRTWPKAHAAFRAAVRSVIRISSPVLADASPDGEVSRVVLADALLGRIAPLPALVPPSVLLEPDPLQADVPQSMPETAPLIDTLIAGFRSHSGDGPHQPQDFIARD